MADVGEGHRRPPRGGTVMRPELVSAAAGAVTEERLRYAEAVRTARRVRAEARPRRREVRARESGRGRFDRAA